MQKDHDILKTYLFHFVYVQLKRVKNFDNKKQCVLSNVMLK
jgi:hypothetical protein